MPIVPERRKASQAPALGGHQFAANVLDAGTSARVAQTCPTAGTAKKPLDICGFKIRRLDPAINGKLLEAILHSDIGRAERRHRIRQVAAVS